MTSTHHGNGHREHAEPDVGLASRSPHQPVSHAGRDVHGPMRGRDDRRSKRERRGVEPARQTASRSKPPHARSRRSPRQSCRRSRRQPTDAINDRRSGRPGKRTRVPGVPRITPEPERVLRRQSASPLCGGPTMNAIVALALPGACFWAKAQAPASRRTADPAPLDPRELTSERRAAISDKSASHRASGRGNSKGADRRGRRARWQSSAASTPRAESGSVGSHQQLVRARFVARHEVGSIGRFRRETCLAHHTEALARAAVFVLSCRNRPTRHP
jgi:hypothetical protein